MGETANQPDVVVVGGGVIGLAVAWRSAQRNLVVTVVDPAPGSGASGVAAGMLAPVTEVHYGEETLLALNLDSAQRWPAFARQLEEASDLSIGFRENGTMVAAYDADDRVQVERLLDYQLQLGLPVRRLRSRELRGLEPMVSPSVRGGLLAEGDHRVDPRALTRALTEACRRANVCFVRESAAHLSQPGAEPPGTPETSVVLESGTVLTAATVVVAAGCASQRLVEVPVRPVKGQIVTLAGSPDDPLLTRALRGIVRGSSVYLVPRDDGRLVIGATVEEKEWDTTVTAGAVHQLLRDAALMVPGVEELALAETIAGLRPATPDNAPLIGGMGDGVVVATGHFRNGILLTPVTADTVAELLATGKAAEVIAPFSPERFR